MKGLIRGAAGLAIVLAMSACNKDETVDLMGPPTGIQATPVTAFTLKGDSVAILLRLVNDRNQAIPAEFTISAVGPALQVVYDANYRPDYTGGDTLIAPAIKPQQRYFARGFNIGKSTFTATAGGFSQTITVIVRPKTLEAALNKITGLIAGDTVTVTAPAGMKFTPQSVVTLATGSVAIASRAADSSNIKFVVGPGAGGVATVTNVFLEYAPTLALATYTTTNAIVTTPAVAAAPTTVSNAAPSIGASITLTLGGSLRFLSTSRVTIGGIDAAITAISADSATATVVPSLSSTGTVAYVNIALSFLTGVPLSVPSDNKSVVPTATYGGSTLAGGTTLANAPEIPLPTVIGLSTMTTDQGAFGNTFTGCTVTEGGDSCRLYKIVVPAGRTYTVTGRWNTNADIGIYRFNDVGGGASTVADALGESATRAEAGSLTNLAAGTYYIALVYYGPLAGYNPAQPVPTTVQLKFTRTN